VGSDFPGDLLRLFVYLAGDRRPLTTQHVLVSAAYHTILINRKLEEHIGVALLLLCESPDSERQPIWLLARFRGRGCRRLLCRFVCQRYCLVCILRRARRSLTIHIDIMSLVDHIDAVVINRRLVGSVVERIDGKKGARCCQRSGTPPPPGIATPIPTAVSPPV